MKLGFPTGVYGARDMPAHDARAWDDGGRLGVSLAYVRDIFHYLDANKISMYRLHDELVPGMAHRAWTEIEQEIRASFQDLAFLGEMAATQSLRLSWHPQTAVVLNAPNQDHFARALVVLRGLTAIAEAMGRGPDDVIVLHVGGVYGDHAEAKRRFVERFSDLPNAVRARVVLENDDRRFGLRDVLDIHAQCGVPIVLDALHHRVLNPERIPIREALGLALATWPLDMTPKVHYATARSDMRTWGSSGRIKPPTWTEHADFVNPFDFSAFLCEAQGLRDFDIMLEAKARDLALIKLRQDLARFESDVAAMLT